jgi:hypothetical protein
MKVYKYFKEKQYFDQCMSGNIVFSPINYFNVIEDKSRQDHCDGHAMWEIQINGVPTPTAIIAGRGNADSTDWDDETKTRNAEQMKVLISCFSTQYSEVLKDKFGKYVIVFDTQHLLNSILLQSGVDIANEMEYRKKYNADEAITSDPFLQWGMVQYSDMNVDVSKAFMTKHVDYSHEHEWRISILFDKYCNLPPKYKQHIEGLVLGGKEHISHREIFFDNPPVFLYTNPLPSP